MRLSMKTIHPCYLYVFSLILIISLYTQINFESSILFVISFIVSLYVFKGYCKSIFVSLIVVALYLFGNNVREGMKNNDDDDDDDDNNKNIFENAIDLKKAKASNSKKTANLKQKPKKR
jgi:hypothetical protein